MSTTTLNTKFQLRRDTLTNWTTGEKIIADGEPILVRTNDGYRMKIGTGTTFNQTEYYDAQSSGNNNDDGGYNIYRITAPSIYFDDLYNDGFAELELDSGEYYSAFSAALINDYGIELMLDFSDLEAGCAIPFNFSDENGTNAYGSITISHS